MTSATRKFNRPHLIIPQEDNAWIESQKPSIRKLWHQCWSADPYGSRWVEIATDLSAAAFRLARKILSAVGLFEFKRECAGDDARRTARWLVRNLHGARVKNFWQKDASNEADKNTTEANKNSDEVDNISPEASTPPENPEKTDTSEPLSNVAETPQQHLTDVAEENNNTLPEDREACCEEGEEDKDQSWLEKLNPKLKSIAEQMSMKIKGIEVSPQQSVKNIFARYKYEPSPERIEFYLQLDPERTRLSWHRFTYAFRNRLGKESVRQMFDTAFGYTEPDTRE
jgi:hypothetical protein